MSERARSDRDRRNRYGEPIGASGVRFVLRRYVQAAASQVRTLAGKHRRACTSPRRGGLRERVVRPQAGSEWCRHRATWQAGPLFVASGLLLLSRVHALLEDLVYLGR